MVIRATARGMDDEALRERGLALWKLGENLFRLDRF